MGTLFARLSAVVLLLAFGLAGRPASATRFHVTATTVGEAYQQVTSDRGLLNRRRLTQTLGLGAHDLIGDDSDRLALVTRLRLRSDFGLAAGEADRIPGLYNHELAFMLGYVEGRELIPWTDFRAGRQLLVDPASGLLLLDGLQVDVRTPVYLGLRAVAGREARGGFMTASELVLDGVEDDGTTIIAGGGVFLTGVPDVDARVDYQHWIGIDAGDTEREVVAASLFWRIQPWLTIAGDARWDFFASVVDDATAELRVRPWEPLELQLDYARYVPVFRADSIWNVFATEGFHEVGGRLRARVEPYLTAWFGAGARLYGVALKGGETDVVLRGGLVFAFGATRVRCEYLQEGETGGTFRLLDLGAGHTFGEDGGFAGIDGRITVLDHDDQLRSERRAIGFGAELGGWYRVRDVATFHLTIEENESALQRHQVRVLLVADLSLWME